MSKAEYGVSSLTWAGRSLHDAILQAGLFNFESIDLGMLNGWTEFGPAELVREMDARLRPVENALAKTGLVVASINAGFGTETDKNRIIEQSEALCQAAKRLDAAAGVTLAAPPANSTHDAMIEYIRPINDVFTKAEVNLMFETHYGQWTENVANTLAMLQVFPRIRLTLDASHYIIQGLKPEDWADLIPYTSHCHIRPCGENGWDEVQIDPEKTSEHVFEWLRLMAKSSYQGRYSLELIENFSSVDAEKASLQMRELLLRQV